MKSTQMSRRRSLTRSRLRVAKAKPNVIEDMKPKKPRKARVKKVATGTPDGKLAPIAGQEKFQETVRKEIEGVDTLFVLRKQTKKLVAFDVIPLTTNGKKGEPSKKVTVVINLQEQAITVNGKKVADLTYIDVPSNVQDGEPSIVSYVWNQTKVIAKTGFNALKGLARGLLWLLKSIAFILSLAVDLMYATATLGLLAIAYKSNLLTPDKLYSFGIYVSENVNLPNIVSAINFSLLSPSQLTDYIQSIVPW